MKSYGFEVERVGEVSDKVFATVKQGLTTFPELAASLGRVAGTASIAGMSFEEMLALTATATRGLGNTNEAVTSLIGVLRAFLNPQEDAIEVAKEFGLVLDTSTLRSAEGFLGAVKKLNKATPEQLSAIVGNVRGFKALAVALKDTAGFEKDLAAITAYSAGRMEEAFGIMADTASFELGQLKQETVDLGRVFGTVLLPSFRKFVSFLKREIQIARTSVEGSFGGIQTSGEKVLDTIIAITDRIKEYVAIANDPAQGLPAAFTLMFEDLKQVFINGWNFLKEKVMPIVKEVASAMGDAFMEVIGNKMKAAIGKYSGGDFIDKIIVNPTGTALGKLANFDLKTEGQRRNESLSSVLTEKGKKRFLDSRGRLRKPVGEIDGTSGGGS